jgi:hypothetical protein
MRDETSGLEKGFVAHTSRNKPRKSKDDKVVVKAGPKGQIAGSNQTTQQRGKNI